MCIVSDKIKFCTCIDGSYEELPHYWLLYRYNQQKNLLYIGEPVSPYEFDSNFFVNQETLSKRLNEDDAFDKKIEFKPKDLLEIVINNLSDDKKKPMTFCFRFIKGKWVIEEYDPFELMNNYDEQAFGNFDNLEQK